MLVTNQEADNNTIVPTYNSPDYVTRKDQYQEKTSTSKKISVHVRSSPQFNRKGKGFTRSMDMKNSHRKTDVWVLGDYV